MNVDVLAVQEVEDLDTLRHFNREYLNGMYRYTVLVEGNDPRLIDVGVLSKFPIGGITSWNYKVHPDDPGEKVFGRDMVQVQILNHSRSKKLFTIFNNHLKSHYVDFREEPIVAKQLNNLRRSRQAQMIAEIVKDQTRPNSRFIILGDMNDPVNSQHLQGFIGDDELNLVNALANPIETRPPKKDNPPPSSAAWSYRIKLSGKPARYDLYDQIWLSPSLAKKQTGAWIDRRKRHGGDGSDHDLCWIKLRL